MQPHEAFHRQRHVTYTNSSSVAKQSVLNHVLEASASRSHGWTLAWSIIESVVMGRSQEHDRRTKSYRNASPIALDVARRSAGCARATISRSCEFMDVVVEVYGIAASHGASILWIGDKSARRQHQGITRFPRIQVTVPGTGGPEVACALSWLLRVNGHTQRR